MSDYYAHEDEYGIAHWGVKGMRWKKRKKKGRRNLRQDKNSPLSDGYWRAHQNDPNRYGDPNDMTLQTRWMYQEASHSRPNYDWLTKSGSTRARGSEKHDYNPARYTKPITDQQRKAYQRSKRGELQNPTNSSKVDKFLKKLFGK